MKHDATSWGNVADWYDQLIQERGDNYQKAVILPNIVRALQIKKGDRVLDCACGQGFFSKEFFKIGAQVIGVDIAKELIELARTHAPKKIDFQVSPADDLRFINAGSVDKAVMILAIQNIENAYGVFAECARVLKPGGTFALVLNHPAFRIPQFSSWGWEERPAEQGVVQYRRIDRYLSELRAKISMHPGSNPEAHTWTFHRPLQYYFKGLAKVGFAVTRLEEWNSHKESQPGPRAEAENRARKEIPMFLYLQAEKRLVAEGHW